MQRNLLHLMLFPSTTYKSDEVGRILAMPKWRQYIRIAFVLSLDWMKPSLRDRLGIR